MKILINKITKEIVDSGNNVNASSDKDIAYISADLSSWVGYEIFYNPIKRTFERGCKLSNFQSWNNTTKIEHPTGDVIGYNTELTRIEFYIKSLDQWFYLWSEFIAITEIPTPPYYTEDFETGWFIDNTFVSLFTEDLETNWFTQNLFIQLFSDDLESNWFINNTFNLLFTETFEGGW